MVSPRLKPYGVTLWPDEAMRRDVQLIVGIPDAARQPQLAGAVRRRADALLHAVADEVWSALGGDAGDFDVELGVASPRDAARSTVEVFGRRGEGVPPEVAARVRDTVDAVWARTVDAAAAATRAAARRRLPLPG